MLVIMSLNYKDREIELIKFFVMLFAYKMFLKLYDYIIIKFTQ